MQSLIRGERGGKRCTDCHKPSRKVLEHRIPAHLDKMECYACHSAWGAQEYGTFFIRFKGKDESRADFRLVTHSADYVKSAYLRKQDAPPLGINNAGRVSPIRPEFILYLTVLNDGKPVGEENRLLSAEWRAFFPHTIRRGSVMCDGCHNNPRRFVFEPKESRIYQIEKDGMGLESFWDRKGQTVVNGSFMSEERYRRMNEASPAYQRDYVQKWQKLIEGVEK